MNWRWLDSDPGPFLSLAVFLLAAISLGLLLNALAPHP